MLQEDKFLKNNQECFDSLQLLNERQSNLYVFWRSDRRNKGLT